MTTHKAWVAAIIAALASFIASVEGRPTVDGMGPVDWLIVVLSAVVAGLVTFTIPNKPRAHRTPPQPE